MGPVRATFKTPVSILLQKRGLPPQQARRIAGWLGALYYSPEEVRWYGVGLSPEKYGTPFYEFVTSSTLKPVAEALGVDVETLRELIGELLR